MNTSIFRSYDIRGIYPEELNEDIAFLIGRAFAKRSKAKKIVIGSDMRLSGPVLKKELIRGIISEGVDVIDIGLVAVDVVYFAVGILKYDAGIMITASHNPKEYNGFKMVLKNMEWLRGEDLREDVLSLPEEVGLRRGRVKQKDILKKYIKHIVSFCELKKIKPLRVVIDAGNGMAGKIIPFIEKHLPIKVLPLNFSLDGNFPSHPSNPLLPESQTQAVSQVLKEKADFGVIFDGDTDRLIFIDEKGKIHLPDYTLLILAKEFLNREPGKGVAYNLVCSKIVGEKVKEWGGVPLRTKVGFVNISAALKENNGIVGGEVSAHYCFRDNAYSDSGFIAFVILLQLLSSEAKTMSEVMAPFYKYAKAPEINFVTDKKEEVIGKIKEKYSNGKQDFLDGITVECADWWFNVRSSNTEPIVRLTIEADNKELLQEKKEELVNYINSTK